MIKFIGFGDSIAYILSSLLLKFDEEEELQFVFAEDLKLLTLLREIPEGFKFTVIINDILYTGVYIDTYNIKNKNIFIFCKYNERRSNGSKEERSKRF